MNASFPYEELIARKLGELPPLPEMADSIWQRISTELDRDLPTDDNDFGGGDPGPQGGNPVAGWKGWSWLILLAGIAALFIYQLKKTDLPVEQNVPAINQPIDSTELLPSPPGLSPPGPSSSKPSSPVIINSDKDTRPDPGAEPSPLPDSTAVLQAPVLDATAPELKLTTPQPNAEPIIKQPDNLQPDSAGGRKRPSGIKGIRSDDYRIVPPKGKKDST